MTVKERLDEFLKHKGIKPAKFEKTAGISNGYVKNIRNSIGPEVLTKILTAYPDLNKLWLLHDEGEMLLTAVKKDSKKEASDVLELNALTTVMARNLAKLQAKVYGRSIDECLDEFDQDVRSEMRRLVNNKQ